MADCRKRCRDTDQALRVRASRRSPLRCVTRGRIAGTSAVRTFSADCDSRLPSLRMVQPLASFVGL